MHALHVRYRTAALGLALLALQSSSASAQPAAEPFFQGKTITLYIGFAPGGGYDYYGRAFARHIGRHIPGNPNVVAQSMPGAGSFRAANFLYSAAPKDGTALGIVTQSVALEAALGNPGAKYQPGTFGWIGRMTATLEVQATWHTSKTKTIEDAKVHETAVASTGAGAPSDGFPKLLNAVIGTRFKVIPGYPGSTDGMLAMERGEVDGAFTQWNTLKRTRQDWLKNGRVNLIVQYGHERASELRDVPTIVELGRTNEDRQVFAFYAGGDAVGRSIMGPPGIPDERLQILRRAFDAMLKDADFRAEIEKSGGELESATGEETEKIVRSTADAPPAVIERTRAAIAGK